MTIRACSMACLGVVAVVIALAPVPALAATTGLGCAKANLDNPGHHYGLIKNGCVQPPQPPPVPRPLPSPFPTPLPTPHSSPATIPTPVAGGATGAAARIRSVTPSSGPAPSVTPADTAPAPLNLTSPAQAVNPGAANVQADDRNVWILGLVGSALLLLLLIALAVATYLRRRSRAAAAPVH